MAFIFSTSHLPEPRVRRPDHLEDEEDDDVMQPMPRAGGVRAFSHLPVRDNPAPSTAPLRADSPRIGLAPIPPRSATASTPGSPMAEAQNDAPLPEADSDPEDDTAPQDHADDRPWYMPRITAQDLPPQDHPEDAHAPAPKPWENTTRSSGFDDAPPADRSTSSNGFSPSPQDLRDAFHAPTPDSTTREAPAQDNRPALTRGHIFEKRSAPAAFLMQQQARGANPPAPGGTPAAQQPVQPQAPTQASAQSGATMQQNQGTDTTKQGAGATPAKDGRDPLTMLSEKFAAFPDAVKALKQLYTLPTGKLMIDKLATVADKIKIGLTTGPEGYMDGDIFRVRRDIDEFTLAHEFQHLGELIFGDKNPFLKVEHPEDLTKYPDLTHYDKEFRAMRMQNQIRLERSRMNKTIPFLHPTYYDKTGGYPIPGSRLPQQ